MAGFDNFLVANPRYFEPMSRYQAGSEYLDLLSNLLPNDWEVVRHDVWLGAAVRGSHPPDQGLKIHVSATARDAQEILRRVAQVCLRSRATFKVAADRRILAILNAKRCARGSSGKFMTVYPSDQEHFLKLIDDIAETTKGFTGPYILSDRRYKDSKVVFYRYGGFVQRRRLIADGTTKLVIAGAGGTIIDDDRTPFFSLPEGIEDPFPAADEMTDSGVLPLLQNRFQIIDALAFSNSGGVYTAIDGESEETVIVKEARPYTHSWSDGLVSFDAISLLQREYNTLDYLRDLLVFPRPIALFQEWEHWFLVQEFVSGEALRTYRARDDVILMAHIYEPDKVASFGRIFRTIGQQLIEIIKSVHARGFILGDISPNNILIDPSDLSVRFIDLESAFRCDEPPAFAAFARLWRTPGFRELARFERGDVLAPADDWFALAMLLHGLVIPIEGLVELYPDAAPRFLRRFVNIGLPQFVETAIANLLAGDVEAARQALAS
ncbi:MAG: serine/threonine-protein kinase [Gemmatimonadota bacterium]|nr:serine/threonine-protein kinase [Gemmatimonadota bacterium]